MKPRPLLKAENKYFSYHFKQIARPSLMAQVLLWNPLTQFFWVSLDEGENHEDVSK